MPMPKEVIKPYPNLDKEGIYLPYDWDELAEEIVKQNYGFARMVFALYKAYEALYKDKESPFAQSIEKAILDNKNNIWY